MGWSAPVTPTVPVEFARATVNTQYTGFGTATATTEGTSFDEDLFEQAWSDAVADESDTGTTAHLSVGWLNGAEVTGTLGHEIVTYNGTLRRAAGVADFSTVLHNPDYWPSLPSGGPWDLDGALAGQPWGYNPDGDYLQWLSSDATPVSGGDVRVFFTGGVVSSNVSIPTLPSDSVLVTAGGNPVGSALSAIPDPDTLIVAYDWPGVTVTYDSGLGLFRGQLDLDVAALLDSETVSMVAESTYNSTPYPFGGTGASLLFGGRSMAFATTIYAVRFSLLADLPQFRYWVPYPGIDVKYPGRMRTVGSDSDMPLHLRTPDGWRIWPGTTAPMHVKTGTGWRRIL